MNRKCTHLFRHIAVFSVIVLSMFLLSGCFCKHENAELLNYVKATCTEEGYTGDEYCPDCEKIISVGTVEEKARHKRAKDLLHEEEADCFNDGYTGDVYCDTCGKILKEGKTIPSPGHTPGEPQYAEEATCTSEGYTGDIYCTVCDYLISRGEDIPELGHSYTIIECDKDTVCDRCEADIEAPGHEWIAPTTTTPKTCSVCKSTYGSPLVLPFYGVESEIMVAEVVSGEEFFSLFTSGEITVRTDREAIDYYTSTEGVDAVYDDGKTAILVSASGWYLAEVQDATTVKITTMLQLPYCTRNDSYTSASCSVYKTEHGFWILGQITNYNREIMYLDLDNATYYYKKINNTGVRSSFDDRYTCMYDSSGFIIIDKDKLEAHQFATDHDDLDYVPFFDENGRAILLFNSRCDYDDINYYTDFHDYSTLYYYSWENAAANRIAYKDYSVIHYADPEKILVENEFTFDIIIDGESAYTLDKKAVVDTSTAMYSFQQGRLWQYGNDAYYYHTFYMDEKAPLLTHVFNAPTSEKVDFSYIVGWSGRYSDCHNYTYTDHSIDHESAFDHYTGAIHVLSSYHRNDRIYNQNHVLWNDNLDRSMGGIYGVYDILTGKYTQRNYIY